MSNVRKSLAFSVLDRYASLVVGIVSTMVLARLLTPSQLGVYSVAMSMLTLASTVRDMGAGNYLLQEKELTTDRIRAVWALQLGLGVLLAAVVALLSGPAAHFYEEPGIRLIMGVLALNYLVNPVGSLTYAWLMREMRYDAIATMRLASTLATAVVSIVLAWHGHGALSLAWGSLCGTVVNALVSMAFRPPDYPWLPGFKELPRVMSFGIRLTSTSILNTMANAAPEFLLGKSQGMAAAGFYSRANGLVALFARLVTDALYSVALSMFSQQARSGQDYSAPFLRALAYLTALSWAFFAGLALLAYPTILLLYGAQWTESVTLTRWLAVAAALNAPVTLCTAALIGAGELGRMVRATVVTFVGAVCAAAIGALFGLAALGPAAVVASLVGITNWLRLTQAHVGFAWRDLARACGRSLLVAAVTASGPAAAVAAFGWTPERPWAPLLLAIAVGVPAFVFALLVTGHPLADELRRAGAALTALRARRRG